MSAAARKGGPEYAPASRGEGSSPLKVLIKGAGEQASATAHRLFRCGFRVVMTELERPTAVRRTVSFCTAIRGGEIEIEGVRGVRHELAQAETLATFDWSHIPVFVDPAGRLQAAWNPDVIVDGRLLKMNLDNHCRDADLVIGLGPGLIAGRDVHYVVETHRGHYLGRIITKGPAARNTGQPGEINGYTRERVLLAPRAGRFVTHREIGERVRAGDVVGEVTAGGPRVEAKAASIAEHAPPPAASPATIPAGISGVIRGLLATDTDVGAGQKLGDIDPRGDPSFCHTLSDKARTISGSVLEIVIRHARVRSGAPD